MIVVTGATGQLGRSIVDNLLDRMPGGRIVASVRDPATVAAFIAKGVTVRSGDFAMPEELVTAFAGATQVLVTSVDKLGEYALKMHRDAITAACAAGARRVLYTSHMGARPDSPFVPAGDHAATEAFLATAGHSFTSLRHGFYTESCLHMIGHGLEADELRVPEDGPVSWTARADLAEADAIILADEGRLDGITPPLTAPEAFTMADLAAIASELTGRQVKHVTVSDQDWLDAAVARGVPAPMAELLLGSYRASRRGDFAATDATLTTLLGRRPQTMRDVLTRKLRPVQVGA